MNRGLLIYLALGAIVTGLAAGTGWAAWARLWGLAAAALVALLILGVAIWFALHAWKA